MRQKIGIGLLVMSMLPLLCLSKDINQDHGILLQKGIDACRSGLYDEAIQVLTQVLNRSVDQKINERALMYLGYTYFAQGNLSEAKAPVEEVIRIHPQLMLDENEFGTEFSNFYESIKSTLVGIAFIQSLPSDATIWMDKSQFGKTPLKIELIAQKYLLRAVKPGYSAHEEAVVIQSNSINTIKLDLTKGNNWKKFITSSLMMAAVTFLVFSL